MNSVAEWLSQSITEYLMSKGAACISWVREQPVCDDVSDLEWSDVQSLVIHRISLDLAAGHWRCVFMLNAVEIILFGDLSYENYM